ncbi:uncharacterized protein LOC110062286 [Orbicella faveolata]|uniref:uncharacterized protein LOC110062286 n=1 Tax=Orbicella faveolata TaxID=48498 RepID=UPI0009E3EDE3|nr:uncharacterized protein LOC110062286 [Orbicella faveolata]
MYMICCKLKIIYYIGLIAYHVCDVCFDWSNYHILFEDNTVSGILTNSATNSSTNSRLTACKISFISCVTGTLFSITMIVAYGYYIKFHWYCIHHASYRSAKYSDGEFSIFSDRGCDKKCNRKFVALELWVSALELFLKDDIQSGILFWIYNSQFIKTKPYWQFIVLQACSITAHLKLGICFMAKLFGWGAGEETCCDVSCAKILASVIGLMGSVVFLGLTVVSLVEAVNV